MKNRDKDPAAEIALALPDFKRYRNLLRDRRNSLERLAFTIYFVDARGDVQRLGPEELASL
jgi:hypothetical protein